MFQPLKILDISLKNQRLYHGCKITPVTVKGRETLRLDTPIDSAAVMLAANLRQLIQETSPEEWSEVELTGGMSPWAFMTAQAVLTPYLKRLVHYNGQIRVEIPIPGPKSA